MDILVGTKINPSYFLDRLLKEETIIVSEDMKVVINPKFVVFAEYSRKLSDIIIQLEGDYDIVLKLQNSTVTEVKINW